MKEFHPCPSSRFSGHYPLMYLVRVHYYFVSTAIYEQGIQSSTYLVQNRQEVLASELLSNWEEPIVIVVRNHNHDITQRIRIPVDGAICVSWKNALTIY